MKKHLITVLCALAAVALIAGAASAAERTDRPAKEAAGAADKCSPVLNGDWFCQNAKTGKRRHLTLSLETDGSGAERLVVGSDGASRGSHTPISYLADGRRHRNANGFEYAASCNHRTKTRGYKIFRIAFRHSPGRVRIAEYVIMHDGRMVHAGFWGTMDRWDVKNSSRPPEPDDYSMCAKLE